MDSLFEQFIRERRYLKNLSENTLDFYRYSYLAFCKAVGHLEPAEVTQGVLNDFIIKMRESGVSVGGINAYIRGLNTFIGWLKENEHIGNVRLKQLKAEKPVLRSLTDKELKRIFDYKPQTMTEKRLKTILTLIADTGLRINEALTLQRSKIDFDNLLFSITGKGNKERIIPFSYELRKVLYKYIKGHRYEFVFCSRDGVRLRYDNARRDQIGRASCRERV